MQSQLRAGSQRFVPGNLSADCPFLFDCIKLATGPVFYYIPENVSNPRTVKRLWPWFHLAIVALSVQVAGDTSPIRPPLRSERIVY